MKILILGNGYLGNKLFDSLSTYNVDLISKKSIDYTSDNFYSFLESMDYKTWTAMPDIIINASGYTGKPNVDAAENDKENCWDLNVKLPVKLADKRFLTKHKIRLIHISSGCIFNGYEKEWEEDDEPNFGVFNPESSFYSKTKHAAETLIKNNAICLRIRIPFSATAGPRDYFSKLLKYDNLISMDNSITCVENFCDKVNYIVENIDNVPNGIYHLVNEGHVSAKEIVEILSKYGFTNPNHRFIDIEDLDVKAKRSNCILSTSKTKKILGPMPNVLYSIEKCIRERKKKNEY